MHDAYVDPQIWRAACTWDPLIMGKISDMMQCLNGEEDRCVWLLTTNGDFSVSTAWDYCHNKRSRLILGSRIWISLIPLQWSVLAWCALNNKLPFDQNIQSKGISLAPRCNCCVNPCYETKNHVFLQSDVAQAL